MLIVYIALNAEPCSEFSRARYMCTACGFDITSATMMLMLHFPNLQAWHISEVAKLPIRKVKAYSSGARDRVEREAGVRL